MKQITLRVNFGGPLNGRVSMIPVTLVPLYSRPAYLYAADHFIDGWEWLCQRSPTDRSFKIQDVMAGCSVFSGAERLAAFIHICCSFEKGDRLIGNPTHGLYRWSFEYDREATADPTATIREHGGDRQ